MQQEYSDKVNYQIKQGLYPSYRHSRIAPNSGALAALVVGGGGTSVFDIPAIVMNLAESRIEFKSVPLTSGGVNMNQQIADVLGYFRNIELVSLSGVRLANIDDVPSYTKIVWKPETRFADMITYGNTKAAVDMFEGLHCVDAVGTNMRYDGSACDRPYIENNYVIPGGANTATPVVNVSISLSRLFNTLFALDKSIYLGEPVQLRITWNSTIGVIPQFGTSATNYATAIGPYVGATIAINEQFLYVAQEQNQNIINDVMNKFASAEGVTYLADYVYTIKLPAPATSNSLQIRLNRTHGQFLKKVYTGLRNQTEANATMYDFTKPAALTGISTSINDKRLQDFDMNGNATFCDDYKQIKRFLRHSCILSESIHRYNWFYVDLFTDPKPLCDKDPNNEIEGVSLEQEQKYTINFTSGTAKNAYLFPVCQRVIKASKSGLQIM